MDELVHYGVDDRIGVITLDSPDNRNALSVQLMGELHDHLKAAAGDRSVRGVLLTATGTVFCAGADLSAAAGAGTGPGSFADVLVTLRNYPKAVVARLNGHARGGGLGLVAAADIVVAPTTATFAFSEVRLGVAPAVIALPCLEAMTPRAVSRYMLTGEKFDAVAAAEAGLVTVAVPPDEIEAKTTPLLDAIRATEPNAVAATRALLRDLPAMEATEAYAHAEKLSASLFDSPEAAEGIGAFIEKRPPSWAEPGD